MTKIRSLGILFSILFTDAVSAQYAGWRHAGSFYVLTTPEGANMPATALEENFPLLVRLNKDWFDFSQTRPDGEDIRFSASTGAPLPYEIEQWDPANGTASIWVRIPKITGNSRQEIVLHWGNPSAASESNGKAVFNESNGYLSVWHMNDPVKDESGTLESKDNGTTPCPGMIGTARHFSGGKGIFCGDKIPNFPSGSAPHTSEAWFKAEKPNATILGWGNEGGGQGTKVRMQFRSPPHIHVDSDFADVNGAGKLPMAQWIHVVHTYANHQSKLYVNGQLDGSATALLNVKTPARLWIGGWYDNYDFVGDIDEVRVSEVARSADWVRLEYENQKAFQTLAGLLVPDSNAFSVSPEKLTVLEGQSATLSARAGSAEKIYWILKSDGIEKVVATDRLTFIFDAGRVTGDKQVTLQFKAICADEVKTRDIPVTIKENIPEPALTLRAPEHWDGRQTIQVIPQIINLKEMREKGAVELHTTWSASGLAVVKDNSPEALILKRAQNSGQLTVTATIDNGGRPTIQSAQITVTEPPHDPWISRTPDKGEMPQDNQFYPRDDNEFGTLYCNGALDQPADSIFLKLYADDALIQTSRQKPAAENAYAFSLKLKAGLIKYRVELGTTTGAVDTILHQAGNILCGDAYLIDGQSNALATDTSEQSPRDTSDWIRSYAAQGNYDKGTPTSLWCNPVWKADADHKTEIGWWGMELAKRLVKDAKVPIFIINGAVGGTRIDQHQRNPANPEDLDTIYGRMLWRVRQAHMTHGIRAILWHQGENDQGADGPGGGYGWETYQNYFLEMSAAWKQDFPNLQHYYLFQIWPNSCSMGGGHGDMLREVQRTLPALFSNLDVMSTLGVRPPGSCHFPLVGWSEFSRLIEPLIERDIYGVNPTASIGAPNLKRACFTSDAKDAIALEFDQPVVWKDTLISEFYPDGEKGKVASGGCAGNVVTLKLKEPSTARRITYLKETSWSQDRLLFGINGIAALTFCDVAIAIR